MSAVFPKGWGGRAFVHIVKPLLAPFLVAGFLCIPSCIPGVSTLLFPEGFAVSSPLILAAVESTLTKPALIKQKLVGQWLTKEPQAGDLMIFLFSTDGKFFIVSDQASSGKVIACQFQYKVNVSSQPMQLDIVLDGKKVIRTIFEFTPEGDLRLQMQGTQPGKPLPTELADHATGLQKISDDTALPSNTELKQSCPEVFH
jgi:hypothetical protein